MNAPEAAVRCCSVVAAGMSLFCLFPAVVCGQVLFEDEFDGDEIDASKWRLDDRPFETGDGDFTVTIQNGQLLIGGTATRNWWGGLALATVPTFSASSEEPLTFEVDRIMHERRDNIATGAGEDSSTRTSIWIADASRSNYVLFSHNSNEGGWTYNKRVGDPDDNATNAGLNLAEFDGFDADFGSHTMGMFADGETVKLFLDGVEGPAVRFPFSEGIVFEVAAYARRGQGSQPADFVQGTFDNVRVTGAGETCVSLTPPFTQALQGASPELTLQLPPGVARPATVTITSSAPEVAVPAGAVGGVLNVSFRSGDPAFRLIAVSAVGPGVAELAVTNEFGECTTDPVKIYVPALLLEDDFESGELDAATWTLQDDPFEDGSGTFGVTQKSGSVRIAGSADVASWPGLAVVTTSMFEPTADTPVTFSVDQTLTSASLGFYRAGVWVTDGGEEFVFFSLVRGGGTDWVVNSTTHDLWPPTGEGLDLAAYNCCTFQALDVARRVELVADGETVAVVMDGVKGGVAPFEFAEVVFGFGVYAFGAGDSVDAVFDNARVIGPEIDRPTTLIRRGDSNNDGTINIADPVFQLNALFGGGPQPACREATDINDDGAINIADPVFQLNALFGGGPQPPPPSAACGPDPDSPGLGCEASVCA